jgi:SAM-dependent methyltransferase
VLRHGACRSGGSAPRGGADWRRFFIRHARRSAPGLPIPAVRRGRCRGAALSRPIVRHGRGDLGIHHVSRPGTAIAEALRVLRPGGRLAFTTWATPAENVAWRLLFDAIRAHGDLAAADAPPSGGNLGTSEAVLSLLRDAGFATRLAARVSREWLVSEPRDIVIALASGTVRTAALIAAQPTQARPAIEAAVAKAAARYGGDDGFAVPIVAILAYGVKSA